MTPHRFRILSSVYLIGERPQPTFPVGHEHVTPRSFTGLPCNAGQSFAVVYPDGQIVRCLGSRESIGNLRTGEFHFFDEVAPCRMESC